MEGNIVITYGTECIRWHILLYTSCCLRRIVGLNIEGGRSYKIIALQREKKQRTVKHKLRTAG